MAALIRALLVAVLLVPAAGAGWGATVEGGVYEYTVDTFNFARDNPPTGELFTRPITVSDKLAFPAAAREMNLMLGYSLSTAANNVGIWEWTVAWDGVDIPNCFWQDETPAVVGLGVRSQAYTVVNCRLDAAQSAPGSHNLTINRAAVSGSPAAVQHEFLSYRLVKHDFLEANMTNDLIEAIEIYLPLFVGLLLLLVGEYRRDFIYRALGGLGIIAAVIFGPYGDFTRLLLGVVGFYLLVMYMLGKSTFGKKVRSETE